MSRVAAGFAFLFATSLPAQVTPTRWVSGLVVDSLTGRPVKGADVYFSRPGNVQTDPAGAFRIEQGPSDTILAVRLIGFVPERLVVPVSASAEFVDIGHLAIRAVATRLDRIAVEAEEIRIYPQLTDFYRRKREGVTGQFVTREDIDRTSARRTSEMLRRSNKVEVECDVNVIRSGDECLVKNRRGRNIHPASTGARAQTGNQIENCSGDMCLGRCEMDIFVDGRPSQLKVDEVPLPSIAAMEIYSGPATTPANFGRGTCGVVAIWTTGTRGS